MATGKIRFLIISDTHDNGFPSPETLPKADVVLHCGDLTMAGGLSNYENAIARLSQCDAEVKLAIPGNHDRSLDLKYWDANLGIDDDPEEGLKAVKLFEAARADGVQLLPEGRFQFTLRDGRAFSLYASPYTPEFCNWAYSYGPDEDRFNPREDGHIEDGQHGIPSTVDIVMTHGPPLVPHREYTLDVDSRWGMHCGCRKLWGAIRRAKPRLHCFGHIHEGYGAQVISWTGVGEDYTIGKATPSIDGALHAPRDNGTLLVNASVLDHSYAQTNAAWLVDVDCKVVEQDA
jgi:Icc-related predicted phosphoesterase